MKRSGHAVLLIVPAILAAIGLYAMRIVLPLYAGIGTYNYDPAYVYLFNGVSIFFGFPPAHVDHPGTPTQVVTAIVAGLWWSLFDRAPGTLMDATLADPEKYIRVLGFFFLGCNVAANWFLGRRVAAATASPALGVVAQTGPLFLGLLAPRLVYLSPEPMLLALGMVVLGLLSGEIFGSRTKGTGLGASLAAGAASGIGLAGKMTFGPMLAVLFIARGRWLLACWLAACVAAIVSLTPAYEYAGAIARWIVALATHKGHYGGGERGITDASIVMAQLKAIWEFLPILYAGLLAAVAALALRFDRVSLAILAAFVLQFGLAVKPTQLHYFIAVVPLSGLAVARLFVVAGGRARLAGPLAVLAVCLGALWSGLALQALKSERDGSNAEVREMERAIVRYPDARIVGAFPVPEWTYGVNFGLGYTSFPFRREASVKIPSDITYHRGGSLYWLSAGYGPIRFLAPYLAAGRPVVLVLPVDMPFDRFECEEPVWKGARFHVCRVLRVLDRE